MEIEEFKRIIERMESGLLKKLTDLQFEEYLNSFGEEDPKVFERAIQRVIDTQQWIPVPAQIYVFIKQIRDEDQGRTDRELAEKKELEDARRKPKAFDPQGWIPFGRYMLEKKIKWPKRDAQYEEEVEKLKAKFEKEHPNWQPRKRPQTKRGGITPLGQSLGDAMKNLNQTIGR